MPLDNITHAIIIANFDPCTGPKCEGKPNMDQIEGLFPHSRLEIGSDFNTKCANPWRLRSQTQERAPHNDRGNFLNIVNLRLLGYLVPKWSQGSDDLGDRNRHVTLTMFGNTVGRLKSNARGWKWKSTGANHDPYAFAPPLPRSRFPIPTWDIILYEALKSGTVWWVHERMRILDHMNLFHQPFTTRPPLDIIFVWNL